MASLGEMYLKGEVDGVCDIKQGSRLIISAYEKDPENPIVVSYMANIFVHSTNFFIFAGD